MAEAGYEILDTRLLVGAPWQAYYGSVAREIATLRDGASPAMTAVLEASEREVGLWRQAPDRIAYELVLARPD